MTCGPGSRTSTKRRQRCSRSARCVSARKRVEAATGRELQADPVHHHLLTGSLLLVPTARQCPPKDSNTLRKPRGKQRSQNRAAQNPAHLAHKANRRTPTCRPSSTHGRPYRRSPAWASCRSCPRPSGRPEWPRSPGSVRYRMVSAPLRERSRHVGGVGHPEALRERRRAK